MLRTDFGPPLHHQLICLYILNDQQHKIEVIHGHTGGDELTSEVLDLVVVHGKDCQISVAAQKKDGINKDVKETQKKKRKIKKRYNPRFALRAARGEGLAKDADQWLPSTPVNTIWVLGKVTERRVQWLLLKTEKEKCSEATCPLPVSHATPLPLVEQPQGTARAPDQSGRRTGSGIQMGSGELCCRCRLAADGDGGRGEASAERSNRQATP